MGLEAIPARVPRRGGRQVTPLKVRMAGRFLSRQAGRVGKSVYKSLGELITNSDDSYSRLVADGKMDTGVVREILVVWDKRKSEFHVVDHAEGMTDKDMTDKFSEYGKDTSGSSEGAPVRGLFGQGISDVLFFHQKGRVESIVERALYRCPFISEGGEWAVDPKRTRATVSRELRHALRIPAGNGTAVSFQLAPGVRKPKKRFTAILESYPMLRLINSDPCKRVRYIEIDGSGRETSTELSYEFPEGEPLTVQDVSFAFEDFPEITAHVELQRSTNPLADDESGLLVYDEKRAVYDCTLFGLTDPSQTLFGTVRLTGARGVIIAKMNQEEPEEILSDDRSGFVTYHPFYRALQQAIQPTIEPFIVQHAPEPRADRLSDKQRENQRKALDIFNELYKDMIEDIAPVTKPGADTSPPESGIEFDRRSITATEGKTYRLGLNINVSMIPVGSVVSLECDNGSIAVKPERFEVTTEMAVGGLARRFVTICGVTAGESGLARASCGEYLATVVATISSEVVVYPETMSFEPATATVRPDGSGRGLLFINTNVVSMGSELLFGILDSTTEIALESENHVLVPDDLAYDEVARVRVNFVVGEKGSANLRATDGTHGATLEVRVVEGRPNEPEEPQGKFADWQFGEIGRFQCYYDSDRNSRTCGVLVVNRSHALNQLYFGSEPTKESVSRSMTASAYLANLLLDAALDFMLNEKWKQETASGGNLTAERDPHLYIQRYLATEKSRIGPEFHRLFIDEALLQEYEREMGAWSAVAAE